MITLKYRRPDGTFVAEVHGMPYHVIPSDEDYWDLAVAEAERLGDSLPFEPPPPEIPPQPKHIYKSDIFRKSTDEQAETIVHVLSLQTVRMQQIWANSQYVSTEDDFYPLIEAAFVSAFGEEIAKYLLS